RADPMTRRALLVALGVLVAMAASAQQPLAPVAPAPPAGETALESKAIAVLKASSARLAADRTLSFTAVAAPERPSRARAAWARPWSTPRSPRPPSSGPIA